MTHVLTGGDFHEGSGDGNGWTNPEGLPDSHNSIYPTPAPHKGYLDESNYCSPFQPQDIAELFAESEEDVPWIYRGFLVRGGLTVLAGDPKVGKSTYAYELIERIALGEEFLGEAVTEEKVLLLGLEEHRRDMIARLRRRSEEALKGRVKVVCGQLPFSPKIHMEIADYIMREDIGLVVIDTIPAWWNLKDENDASEVLKKGYPFLNVIRGTNAAWLGLAHTRKSGGGHGSDIRGSSAFVGLVDIAVSMKRTQSGGNQRMLEAVSRYDDTPNNLVIEYAEGCYRKLGSPQDMASLAKTNKVWEALTPEGKTIDQLAKETDLSKQDVSRALQSLGDQVHREGGGHRGDPYLFSRN
ncbi:MAG: AAA family ATPase [Nitrospira sp. BO4]|nr:AAA family ATPase [Nitrospira sp. BO4]